MPNLWNPLTNKMEAMGSNVIRRQDNSNPDNLLKGVVTPLKQSMGRMNGEGFSLDKIYENQELLSMFKKNEFPRFERTADGLFFEPIGKVISTIHTYYVKWFSLNKDFEISHDHNYQFTRIIPNGYLMKVSVPRMSDQISDYEINYVIPVDNIQAIPFYGKVQSERTIDTTSEPTSQYAIPQFDISMYPQLMGLLSDKESFITNYLSDILEN